ncbi:MAG TPA: GNAT family N-acetyltransferase [Gaiellales bacterium]|jgi:ribosomal protein S18 acetylase RimI-like enzyme|nr:GNAT family N-acetyltransferase [Gaiellales bacterium]
MAVAGRVDLRPLGTDDAELVAALHNEAFSDYAIPAVLDASMLAFYMDETDVRPELSHLATIDGVPAAFCLGAVRGCEGSVRGEGTAPAYRRRGLGRQVLELTLEALAGAGAARVVLEVLTLNSAAIALYEEAGFAIRRRLEGWSFRRPEGRLRGLRNPVHEVDAEWAVGLLESWGYADAPWQMQPGSLLHVPAYALDERAVAFGKQRGRRMWLYAFAVDPAQRRRGHGRALLRGLPAPRLGIPSLMPEAWTDGVAFLEALGGIRERHTQYEMTLDL